MVTKGRESWLVPDDPVLVANTCEVNPDNHFSLAEIRHWCNENCSDWASITPGHYYTFRESRDAVAFMLRWG